ncbi:MAG: type II toxin-antitoxin system HicA family toxin [Candidatus Taylorbacteria bacterium]|nr:type II toxin-antitoxin system HicA family toxin [Candidatus Taylorbacteria bacterium]
MPKAKEIIRVALACGFVFARQRGSHAIYRHSDGRRITVPVHGSREISPAVFRQILHDLHLSTQKFWHR